MLRQRLDRNERLERLGPLPVVGQLVGVQRRPLTNKPERTRRQRTVENLKRAKLDLGDVLAVLRVEMCRRMVRSVHPDHDPVERSQAGHRAIVEDHPADRQSASRAIEQSS
jgi:hypothetical protein